MCYETHDMIPCRQHLSIILKQVLPPFPPSPSPISTFSGTRRFEVRGDRDSPHTSVLGSSGNGHRSQEQRLCTAGLIGDDGRLTIYHASWHIGDLLSTS